LSNQELLLKSYSKQIILKKKKINNIEHHMET